MCNYIDRYTNTVHVLQGQDGLIVGAEVKDTLSGKSTQVFAKQVINATGPFTDKLRQMSDPNKPSIIMPSAGAMSVPLFTIAFKSVRAVHGKRASDSVYLSQTVFEAVLDLQRQPFSECAYCMHLCQACTHIRNHCCMLQGSRQRCSIVQSFCANGLLQPSLKTINDRCNQGQTL